MADASHSSPRDERLEAASQSPHKDARLEDASLLAPTYARPDLLFVDGKGAMLEDARGTRFLDMTSGIGVLALGHRSEIVQEAIQEAATGLLHTSNLYHTAPPIELARALVDNSFASQVFFSNSGSEAVEGAIKFARLAGGKKRRKIISFTGSFHGRTLGALAATDRPDYQAPFGPLPGNFACLPWNEVNALEEIGPDTAGVLVEPIQGEGGIHVPDKAWMEALRARCDAVGALLIFDEIQCGLGRSGTLWAHEPFGVKPDIMTLAKPLAGGLPIGAILLGDKATSEIKPGCHGSTFGGGPLVTRVALRVFQELSQPAFLAEVRRKGRLLKEALRRRESPFIQEIRGRGLFVGVRLSIPPGAVVQQALKEHLLLVPAGDNTVRFLPPLNVSDEVLEEAVARFFSSLRKLEEEKK